MENFVNLSCVFGIGGLLIALAIFFGIKKLDAGNERMKDIAEQIHLGAMVFLKTECRVIAIFVADRHCLYLWWDMLHVRWFFWHEGSYLG